MRAHSAILILIVLTLSGCASARSGTARLFNGEVYRVDTPWWDPRTEKLDPSDLDDSLINIATYCFPEHIKVVGGAKREDIGQMVQDQAGEPQVKADHECSQFAYDLAKDNAIHRDRLQDVLMAASDRECDKHKASVLGTNNGLNLGLSMLTSLLSGAATGFSATSTKTALSAAAAFFGSSRSQINEQVYQQLFVGTIILAVDDDRKAQMLEIINRRRYPVPSNSWDPRFSGRSLGDAANVGVVVTNPTVPPPADDVAANGDVAAPPAGSAVTPPPADFRKFYGIDEAIRDAKVYHERCSFYNGIVRLATKVEEFSPCRMVFDRRERLFAELTAIEVSKTQGDNKAKFDAYTEELKVLNTKLAACTPGGSQ